ncbi:MAG: M20 family metallo-hydrolase [Cyclobacteriaceae bacterium]
MSTPSFVKKYQLEAIELLSSLIRTPSFSREEVETAAILGRFFDNRGIPFEKKGNNIWAKNKHFDSGKRTILLNSHHDTVKPNAGYSRNPFEAFVEEGKLYGLGSNDAGGCLVSLLLTFAHFYEQENLPFNLITAATAEEEISGKGGLESIMNELGAIEFAIVGEPTEMKMAVAEKGLMVLDCSVRGTSGHAAREEGVNAIYKALQAIEWFRTYQFEKESNLLGPIKMSVTMIKSGYQHNIVPDHCEFVVDVRTTDAYTNEEVLETIQQQVYCEVQARSTRLKPSGLPSKMLLYQAADSLGIEQFGSSTTSDQAILDIPSAKMGPGKSQRSHTANEFIYLKEIEEGIEGYVELLNELMSKRKN